MKKILYIALAISAFSCTAETDLEGRLYDLVESSADMAMDTLHNVADKELQRHTGIDSLSARIRSADTIDVEREVKRALLKELSK